MHDFRLQPDKFAIEASEKSPVPQRHVPAAATFGGAETSFVAEGGVWEWVADTMIARNGVACLQKRARGEPLVSLVNLGGPRTGFILVMPYGGGNPMIIGDDTVLQHESCASMSYAPILSHLSPASLGEVVKMADQRMNVETPYVFPIAFVTLLFILYFIANLLHNLLLPCMVGRKWRDIKAEHRRTLVVYVLQLVITTLVVAMQLSVCSLISLRFALWKVNVVRACACLIAALYLFELIYRYRMTYPMIAHHLITCFAMSLALVMCERLQDPSYVITGLLWIFQATTEQTTFVALFMYRLKAPARMLRTVFRIAAVQSIVFKFASIAGTIWMWIKFQRRADGQLYTAWDALYWICTAGLAVTQVWGAWVVWKMGDSLEQRYSQKSQQEDELQFTPVLVASNAARMQQSRQSSTTASVESSRKTSRNVSCDLEKAAFELELTTRS
ncbi:uncharacterized protein PAN0_018d5696 [Moesziomyces antarcticus]|uniref:Uncharacterized protein n=2 Tax=Pseudozyma antarctica TaxID=84753 RepID=A0A081CLC2_PSEA2|nr:uncharacterized protein PAN0_018d5696 [Moesziomyces antarcticus]GAK67468.1 conserved hypothetical protein [Moesziomyces antarcticus]